MKTDDHTCFITTIILSFNQLNNQTTTNMSSNRIIRIVITSIMMLQIIAGSAYFMYAWFDIDLYIFRSVHINIDAGAQWLQAIVTGFAIFIAFFINIHCRDTNK